MQKEKSDELSKMFSYAGNYHKLTILGCILAGISTIFSMLPFVCIWFVIRDLIHGLSQGDVTLAAGSSHYAWMALLFSVLSIFLYFLALIFSHLAAFRTATNMRKKAVHHIVELPLGYFSQNASGRLRKVIDDNAGLTEGFLAHQLPDLTGAVVMPVAVIILIFVFDWRMGICCLIPMAVSVIFLKQMMGGDNADFMSKYMTALETMNKEAVEYIRGIPVVKVFQQTIYSFKNFHNAITEYEKFASGYALKCRIPMTGFTVALNSTFILLIPVAMLILSGLSGQISYEETVLDFLFKENIRAARPSATREEVLKAAEMARCTEIIDRLPNGLDTVVGSGGTYLSGGENQRIALARAILKDAPIVVMDEATAFADAENEHQIQLAFEELTKGKSVLMIAHRLSTIQDADQILVFKDGKIIERGKHNELLEKKGTYASMWKDYQTSVSWKVGEGDEKHN